MAVALRVKSILVLTALVLFCGWRSWASVSEVTLELERESFAERWQRTRGPLAERYRRALGDSYPIYRAIVEHVPRGGIVAAWTALDDETFWILRTLGPVVYPTEVRHWRDVMRHYESHPDEMSAQRDRLFVLNLHPEAAIPRQEGFRVVASGEGFVLLRLARDDE